jgi:hypothetical protein
MTFTDFPSDTSGEGEREPWSIEDYNNSVSQFDLTDPSTALSLMDIDQRREIIQEIAPSLQSDPQLVLELGVC